MSIKLKWKYLISFIIIYTIIYVLDATMNPSKVISERLYLTETISDISELSQNVDKICENKNGKLL